MNALIERNNGAGAPAQQQHAVIDMMPVYSITQVKQRFEMIAEVVKSVMIRDRHYGTIPGTSELTLFKPGAELLCTFFGLVVEDPEILAEIEDWTGGQHGGEPFIYYKVRQRLTRNGSLIASVVGSCNSWEAKYRYRKSERLCPTCNMAAIIKSKPEHGGGWFCWGKKGGCGEKFEVADERITSQTVGRISNPDVADLANTILKMAQKRALVGATQLAVNASAFFAEDDDDPKPVVRSKAAPEKAKDEPTLTDDQVVEIRQLLRKAEMNEVELLEKTGQHIKRRIESIDKIPQRIMQPVAEGLRRAAERVERRNEPEGTQERATGPLVSAAMAARLEREAAEMDRDNFDVILHQDYGVNGVAELTREQGDDLAKKLHEWKQRKA